MEGPKRPFQNKHFKTFILPSYGMNTCIPLMQKFRMEMLLIKYDAV